MKQTGSCHCRAVKFEVEMKLEKAISCNCSICQKRGSLLDFVPEVNFKLLAGKEQLTEYQFAQKTIHHLFCKKCGILPFGSGTAPDGKKMYAINVRCIDGVDLSRIQINEYDGRSL